MGWNLPWSPSRCASTKTRGEPTTSRNSSCLTARTMSTAAPAATAMPSRRFSSGPSKITTILVFCGKSTIPIRQRDHVNCRLGCSPVLTIWWGWPVDSFKMLFYDTVIKAIWPLQRRFFMYLASKFAKKGNMTKKQFPQEIKMGIKFALFYANLRSVEKNCKLI